MFQTRITELFGIQYPILMGAMQFLSRAELVAAVANAGGLGFLSSLSFPEAEGLRQEIRKTRSLTNKPFGINITLLPTLRPVNLDAYIDVAIEEGIRIVETAGRSPEPYMKKFKDNGMKVIHKTPAVRFARTAERVGVDAVSILGFEGAGHPGEDDVTSLVLIPLAAQTLKVPVVAAGGFCDARGFVAALALGADGILMGTRFMLTRECLAHPKAKEFLCQRKETDTVLILRPFRNTERVTGNELALKVREMEAKGATIEELGPFVTGQRALKVWEQGEDPNTGILACGQNIGLIDSVVTVKEVVDGIIGGAQAIIERLHKLGAPLPRGIAR